ncbi:excalibur calcium-binding domain-containing protein [Blastococcus sp. VKM Ac-2987]|uniref:excalibur calcium-binding domain-containing protein n=1 Tax=Blastococcus sp. VKM Ac-2987 TaxID=3004141 RepID=UPI0022ABBBE6|nr:excalibur calcium-binding domain-containing protein [Blastococcus sp. VKM Ac-2987]MCZ2859979.1 excalibur calcium-binding domain-containing protein [Blastococcus sp. VKM Ac-2987]
MVDDAQYEFTSVQAIRGTEAKTIAKWRTDGWELDSRDQGLLRTELTFRRVKPVTLGARAWAAFGRLEPKAQRGLVAAAGVLVLLVISGGVVIGVQAGDGTSVSPASAAVAAAEATPTEQPSEVAVRAPEATTPAEPEVASPAPQAPETSAPAPVVPEPQTLAPAPPPAPAPAAAHPAYEPPASTDTFFENCDAARAAGAAPVMRGDAGYGSHLDREGDGIGCE